MSSITNGRLVARNVRRPLRRAGPRAHGHHNRRGALLPRPGHWSRPDAMLFYFAQQDARSYQVARSRAPATTCRIASVTSAGWSSWMKWPLWLAMVNRALGNERGQVLLHPEPHPLESVTGPIRHLLLKRTAVRQDRQRQGAEGLVCPRLASLSGAPFRIQPFEVVVIFQPLGGLLPATH